MDGQEKKGSNNFSTGFLLGLLFGVALTLLLVTKKGRKMLKTLTEEGFENMKDLKSKLKDAETKIDEDLYYDDLEEKSPAPAVIASVVSVSEPAQKTHTNGVKKHVKKLFRGIPKKS